MQDTNFSTNGSAVPLGRGADRFAAELPVEIYGVQGVTQNISATGMYFETESNQIPGSHVHFTVEVIIQGQKSKLSCDGQVIRVDRKDHTVGIAVKLDSSFFTDQA